MRTLWKVAGRQLSCVFFVDCRPPGVTLVWGLSVFNVYSSYLSLRLRQLPSILVTVCHVILLVVVAAAVS